MRTVTKQQVIEAADWCAQRAAFWGCDLHWAQRAPHSKTVRALLSAAWQFGTADAVFSFLSHWADASSILYAAALEGGPMPSGWEMAP